MRRDMFPALLGGEASRNPKAYMEAAASDWIFARVIPSPAGRIATATHELYAGMIELRLSRHLTDIVIVTDVRVSR
jgi:acyl homoserine lactone synthase